MRLVFGINLLLGLCSSVITTMAQSYQIDSVTFKSKADTISYGATITKPFGKEGLTAVVIISGTGEQDRDGTMGGVKWFYILADHLTSKGYAVLRMDDRGVGETTGLYSEATTYDFAQDALEAVEYLKTYPGIDPDKIGLLGHSEGAAASSIAASESKDIKFLISLSGLAMNGLDALISQNEALVNNVEMKERDKIRFNEINALMFAKAYQYADSSNTEEVIAKVYENWRKRDSAFFALQEDKFDTFRFPIHHYAPQVATPWYRFFVRYNAEMYLRNVTIPILAINGNQDNFVVPNNLSMWKKYAGGGQNKNVETHLLSGLNHLLQPEEENKIRVKEGKEKIGLSPEVLALIVEWLKKIYN